MNEKDYKEILAKLTLDEKITMLSGSTNWLTQPVKRDDIDIPAVRMSDGPSGLRREKNRRWRQYHANARTRNVLPRRSHNGVELGRKTR